MWPRRVCPSSRLAIGREAVTNMAKRSAVSEEFTRDDLAKIRELVHTAATEAGLRERADHLVLAVNEVVSNAIRYAGGRGHLTVEHMADGLLVEVCDHGPGLPAAIAANPPPADALGGRGMWLIRRLCPDLEVISGPSGVTVRLFMTAPLPHPYRIQRLAEGFAGRDA